MSEEGKKALTQRKTCRKGFNALSKQITTSIAHKQSSEQIREQLDELKEIKQQVKQHHMNYLIATTTDDAAESDENDTDAYLETLEEKFCSTLTNAINYCQLIKTTQEQSLTTQRLNAEKESREQKNIQRTYKI